MNTKFKNIKAVILDLDQTLTIDQGSWLQFTSLLGADPTIHLDIFNRFKKGELNYIDAKKELIGLWKTTSSLTRGEISKIFEKIELREGVVEAIKYLQSKYHLCIISGAINIFVEVLARKLNIKDYYAVTKFIFDDYDVLIDFQYTLSRGKEKLSFLNEFTKKYNYSLNECAAIGDGDSDMPLFKQVALPILFIAEETSEENMIMVKKHLNSWKGIKDLL